MPTDPRETHAVVSDRAATAAKARYRTLIAQQLVAGSPDIELKRAAVAYLDAIARLDAVTAERDRREADALAAAERIESERRAAVAAAAAEREAAEEAAELAAALARAPGAGPDDRARLAMIVRLRRRLRVTRVPTLRVGRSLFSTSEIALGLGGLMPQHALEAFSVALDQAEAELTGAHPS